MAVYLSPGVFPREIDLSQLPTAVGPLRPAFIGTAKKGPMNQAVFISNATQFIDTFGDPFPMSYLGYAVLAFMEEGNQCYVMRVGVECLDGQPDALNDICIDTGGSRVQGWGRIPLFTGLDYGRINLRTVDSDNTLVIQAASASTIDYNDAELASTYGATQATLTVTATSYSGSIEDSIVMVITGAPDDLGSNLGSAKLAGATYQVIRNSDGQVLTSGTLADASGNSGISTSISLGQSVSIVVHVTSGCLDVNDTFVFDILPDTRKFTVVVEGDTAGAHEITLTAHTYTAIGTASAGLLKTLNDAVTAAYSPSTAPYEFTTTTLEDGTTILQIVTTTKGNRIQVTGSAGWAVALGIQRYAWDIPRAYLIGLDSGPFNITTQNNKLTLQVIGNGVTKLVNINLPLGNDQAVDDLADAINDLSTFDGDKWFDCFVMTVPNATSHVFIASCTLLESILRDHSTDALNLLANHSNLKTLRFADTVAIQYPYKASYRGFRDSRVSLPAASESDPTVPLSYPNGITYLADAAYYQGIVGTIVATSPGTWLNGYKINLTVATDVPVNSAGLYNLAVLNSNNQTVEYLQAISFDLNNAHYIGNVINPGSTLGGINGNSYINWEPRPSYLEFDPNLSDYTVRQPSPLNSMPFVGMADGIPLDPAYSSDLDAAVIGNPAESTGIYAFQNPETIDINLLSIPGFSSGAVIGQALEMCEARGDVLFLVDPPFGLRPQQAVDWHNGMLSSDLRASINSSYGALYWGWLQIYDQFTRNYVWVPPSGHVSAIFSRTSRVAEQWFAPAGLRRGLIHSAIDVEYSPTQGERDLLYGSGNAVNPIVKFPKDGITVWGQRTLQRMQSALDRVNVRMLLIFIKKNLIQVLRNFIFEPNDKILWAQVRSTVDPFLADITARRGLTGFNVVCDATNNTPERIDRNELWVSVFLKPTRTVEFIVLNLVIMQTAASFTAEDVLAAGGIVTNQ